MIYTGPTNFVNDTYPALNAQNMNAIAVALQQTGYDLEALKRASGTPLPVLEQLKLSTIKNINKYYDEDGHAYQEQGLAVTDKYIVLSMNSVKTSQYPSDYDKRNAFFAFDKNTLELASLPKNPVIMDFTNDPVISSSHANCIAWCAKEKELHVRGDASKRIDIVLNADTLEFLRYEVMPIAGNFGYDNVNHQWCFLLYEDDYTYDIRIYNQDKTLNRKLSGIKRQGTTQGVCFNDGLIFIPTTLPEKGVSSILVVDRSSTVVADYWFDLSISGELEDVGVDGNRLYVSSNLNAAQGGGIAIFTGFYIPSNVPSNTNLPKELLINSTFV